MNRNGYAVRKVLKPNVVVGLGLFPAVAMLNHSCSPNCAVVTHPGGVLEVRTLVPLKEGVELTVSYTNLLDTKAKRQLELASKEFTCHCLRCDSPDSYPHERHLTTVHCPRCLKTPPRAAPAHQVAAGTCDFICRNEDGGCGALLKAAELDGIAADVAADIDAAIGSVGESEGEGNSIAAKAVALVEVLRQNVGVTVASEHALVIRAQLILAQLHDRSNFPYEAAAAMHAAISAMRLLVRLRKPQRRALLQRLTAYPMLLADCIARFHTLLLSALCTAPVDVPAYICELV